MRIFAPAITALCLIALTACSGTNPSPEPASADQAFLEDVTSGWVDRWDFLDTPEQDLDPNDSGYDEKFEQQMQAAIAIEIDKVGGYTSMPFEDDSLRTRAVDYVDLLGESKDALQYLNVDYLKFDGLWRDIYDRRTVAILDLIDTYSLELPAEYQDITDEMRTNANLAEERASFESSISSVVCDLEWEMAGESYGWFDYESAAKNTTGTDIDNLSLTLSLLDENGVNVDSSYASVSSWRADQTAMLEFSSQSEAGEIDIAVDWTTADGDYGSLSQPCATN
ncbi:hypothetical protein NYA9BBAC_02554 [Salinibacterium sp. NYA9b]